MILVCGIEVLRYQHSSGALTVTDGYKIMS